MSAIAWLHDLGITCALGNGRAEVAGRLFEGNADAIRLRTDLLTSGAALPYGSVRSTLVEVPARFAHFASRNLQLALTAAHQLEPQLSAAIEQFGADRVAVVMGSSTSGISAGEQALSTWNAQGTWPAEFEFRQQEMGSVAEGLAACLGLSGLAITLSTACTSGAKALATARRLLRAGLADAVVAGGCDSACGLTANGFHVLSALSADACVPFSANRNGTTLGEGAALFLMSREPGVTALLGVGESSDAHNMTAPAPDGGGAAAAMDAAFRDASMQPSSLDYINLHGTGTPLNDAMESRALQRVGADRVPCSSSKGQLGHTLGAAGAIETALCWLTVHDNPRMYLPPHVWDGVADPSAPLPAMVHAGDCLAARPARRLMTNSYAFGGNNMSLIIGHPE